MEWIKFCREFEGAAIWIQAIVLIILGVTGYFYIKKQTQETKLREQDIKMKELDYQIKKKTLS